MRAWRKICGISVAVAVFGILFTGSNLWAAGQLASVEAENAIASGPVSRQSDSNASNGSYMMFGSSSTTSPSAGFQPSAPYYSTFYYPWYGTASDRYNYWNDNGHKAPTNWFANYIPDKDTSKFDPANELYRTTDDSTLYWQLEKMAEAKQEVAISSWWGQGHKTDLAFNKIITDVMNRSDNPYPNLRWALYYEKEGFGNPAVSELVSDLNYIKTKYAQQKGMLKIDGKPVMFVYGDATDGQATVDRWAQARAQTGFYVVLKVFTNYASAANQPDGWHQYAPAIRTDSQGKYSFMVSPGFWKDGDPVRLPRDLASFKQGVAQMVASNATWKMVQTWNEWGEGTSVEPGEQVKQSVTGAAVVDPSGAPFKNLYIDALNAALPALEKGTGRATVSTTSTAAPAEGNIVTNTVASIVDVSLDVVEGVIDTVSRVTSAVTSALVPQDVVMSQAANEGGFSFSAGGDHAFGSSTNNSINVVANTGSSFYLALGDLAYTTSEASWCTNFKSKFNDVLIVSGNHDSGESASGNINNYVKSCPYTLAGAYTGTYGKQYFFDYPQTSPLARFIMISPGLGGGYMGIDTNYKVGSQGYNFTAAAIDQARAAGVKWIVVGMHKNCMSVGQKGGCAIGEDLMRLLVDKKVDLVLQGHEHNYQRSHALKCFTVGSTNSSCIADNGSDGTYAKGAGPVILVTGVFGQSFYGVNASDSEAGYFAKMNGNTFGVSKFTITGSTLTSQFIRSGGGSFSDTFSISGTTTPPTDTEAPKVIMTAPPAGASVSGVTSLTANATDNVGVTRVEFYVDGALKSIDTTAPYGFDWDTKTAANGSHSLYAKAFDAASGTASSQAVSVTVNNVVTQPCQNVSTALGVLTVSINVPADGDYTLWSRVIGADAGSNAYYAQLDNDCPRLIGDGPVASEWKWVDYTDGNQSAKMTIRLSAGPHMVKMIGKEANLKLDRIMLINGSVCTPEGTGDNCTVTGDNEPPTVALTAPTPNATVSGQVQVSANASDNMGVERVEFRVDGTSVHTDFSAPYGFSWNSGTVANGSHALSAIAYGSAGAAGSSQTVSVTVANDSGSPGTETTALKFVPVADATTKAEQSTKNYGSDTTLMVDTSPLKKSLMKFTVTGVNGRAVSSAKLRLYCVDSASGAGSFYATSNAWQEMTVTYANAPLGQEKIAGLGAVQSGRWYEVDVSSYIRGDGTFSLKNSNGNSNGADFASRESTHPPQLIVTVVK